MRMVPVTFRHHTASAANKDLAIPSWAAGVGQEIAPSALCASAIRPTAPSGASKRAANRAKRIPMLFRKFVMREQRVDVFPHARDRIARIVVPGRNGTLSR